MNDKISLIKPDGSLIQVDVICNIENQKNGKKYLYYTLNEIVGTGANSTVKIYVSKINQGNPQLDEPISELEWEELKNIMGNVLRGNENPDVKYLPMNDSNINSVNDRVIAMPTSYDYITKHRGIYAQAVATQEPITQAVETAEVMQPAEPITSNVEVPVETVNVQPVVAEPVINETVAPVVAEIHPEEPAPQPLAAEPTVVPIPEPQPVVNETQAITTPSSTPIDINEIEKKYQSMMDDLLKLKEQEIEAVKRYNATLELSSMHNEQHANYVESQNNKELNINVEPLKAEAPVIEPTPISTVIPEPENKTQPAVDIETNWFDMPNAE